MQNAQSTFCLASKTNLDVSDFKWLYIQLVFQNSQQSFGVQLYGHWLISNSAIWKIVHSKFWTFKLLKEAHQFIFEIQIAIFTSWNSLSRLSWQRQKSWKREKQSKRGAFPNQLSCTTFLQIVQLCLFSDKTLVLFQYRITCFFLIYIIFSDPCQLLRWS